jgi:hypothetical protein
VTTRRILLALALLGWVAYGALSWKSRNPADFYQFWLIGQAAREGRVANVYDESDQRRLIEDGLRRSARSGSRLEFAAARTWAEHGVEPAGTPLLYATFALAGSGDFERDYLAFRVGSVAVYVAAISALALMLRYSAWGVLAAVVLFTRLYWPFISDTVLANAGRLQVALIAVPLLLLRRETRLRDLLAGLCFGLFLLFKPTIAQAVALLGVGWLAAGEWRRALRAAGGGMGGLAIGLAIPPLLFGDACRWTEWRAALPREALNEQYLGGGFLAKLLGLKDLALFSLFGVLLFAATAAVVVVVSRSRRRARAPFADLARLNEPTLVALGLALYLLSGPIVHSHYFLLAVPLALLALRPGRSRWRFATGLFAVVIITAHPFLRASGLASGMNHSLWSFSGVWILFGLGLADFAHAEPVRVDSPPGPERAAGHLRESPGDGDALAVFE